MQNVPAIMRFEFGAAVHQNVNLCFVMMLLQLALTLLEEVSLDLSLPFNITSGQEVSIEELASLIASVVNYGGNVIYDASKPDGSARKALDGKRMRDIRWWAKTKLEYGVAKTYEWYVKNKLQKQASET